MKIAPTDNPIDLRQQPAKPTAEQLRNAAVQFEAILLMQITSALNGGANGDEDSLFGSEAGSGLAKQMFSEQMATTLAQSGGFGISDLMMRQLTGDEKLSGRIKDLSDLLPDFKELKPSAAPLTAVPRIKLANIRSSQPASVENISNANEVEIVSRFEDDLKANGIDDSMTNLILDGRVVNSTRARIVPGQPIVGLGQPNVSGPIELSYDRPLSGRVSSTFGERFHPVDRKSKFHGGVDIAVPTGTPVSAAAEGTVSFAGWKGGYGNLVVIDHPDGRQTRYAHLASLSVKQGDPVSQGQPVALSGSTGKSTGPHLHFEVRENGRVVDPMRILSNVLPKTAER